MSVYRILVDHLEYSSISGQRGRFTDSRCSSYWLRELELLDDKSDLSVLQFIISNLLSYSNEYVAR
jgi:hypothetical protein